MSTEHKEYIVTVHRASDLDDIYNELENSGCGCHGHFPERAIECIHRRPISRSTHYLLSKEEAESIKQDPRVLDVELHPREQGFVKELHWTETSSEFNKNNGNHPASARNWGLLRVFEGVTRAGWSAFSTFNTSGSVTVYASGTNVDVVIIDGLVAPGHPELAKNADGTGGSRVVQYDWFANHNAEVYPSNPRPNYTYAGYDIGDNKHGNHVAGTVAGNTQGWARNANIYSIDPIDNNPNQNFSGNADAYVFDFVRAFHRNKPVNPATGVKNPTITSNSWGWSGSIGVSNIKGVTYRGTTYTTSTTFSTAQLNSWGMYVNGGSVPFGVQQTYLQADVQDALADGVVVIGSAGNSINRNDVVGGPDYNNVMYLYAPPGDPFTQPYYYHRGSSPNQTPGVICVGSIDAVDDRKSNFSNSGPRVDIYAPGSYIISSFSSSTNYGGYPTPVADPRNTSFYYARLSGTSMSSPQVVGVIAAWAERHLTWTQTNYLSNLSEIYATGQIPDTGGDGGDFFSLQGSPNRYLKVPTELLSPAVSLPLTATVAVSSIPLTLGVAMTPTIPVVASDGTPPYTYGLSPTLPTGIAFNTSTGQLSGTPTQIFSTGTFTVTVTDNTATSVSKNFSLSVTAPPNTALTATVLVSSISLPYATAMTPVIPVVASQGTPPYSYGISPTLPTGLTFSGSTGQLSGTPTQLRSTGTFTVTVLDNTSTTVSRNFSLAVTATALTVTLAIPVRAMTVFTATSFMPVVATGGYGTKSYSISPNNLTPFGISLNSSTGVISGTPNALKNPALYTITVTDQAGQTGSKNVTLSIVATAINATANTSTVAFFAYQAVTPFKPVTANGGSGSITYSIAPALPTGLTINSSTGFISGTPVQVKSTTVYTVTVTDQFGQAGSANFNLSVTGVPIFATTVVPTQTVIVGTAVTPFIPISVTGGSGSVTYSLNQPLPQGMTFNTSTGQISGTPTLVTGSAIYTITVTDQVGQQASSTFILRIRSNLPLVFTDEQNLIWNELNALMGTTATGYGTALISQPVLPGEKVYPEDFNLMVEDMVKAIIHQTGTGTNATIRAVNRLRFAEGGTPITRVVPQRLWTELQFLKANPLLVDPSNLTFMTVNTNIDADTTITSTTTTIGLTSQNVEWVENFSNGSANTLLTAFTYAWRRVADANYFFNSGGRFQPLFGEFDFYGNTDEENRWVGTVSSPGPIRQAAEIVFDKTKYLEALANGGQWVDYFYEQEESEFTRTVELKFSIIEDNNGFGAFYRAVIATIQFLIGPVGKKGKKKKNKTKKKKKKGISVNFRTRCSFKTTYATSKNGGISSPRPQSQRSNGLQSASLVPLAPFSIGLDAANSTASRRVYLANNSNANCIVDRISLSPDPVKFPESVYPELYPGYTTGTVSVTTPLTIPANSSTSFVVTYTASSPGSYRGYIFIESSSTNDLVLFTEVNVGDVNPASWVATATTNAILSQDFTVNLGDIFRGFTATITGSGLTVQPTSRETFRLNYNPRDSIPGTYFTTATVNILPADPINGRVRVDVPVIITANVLYENIATFLSATGLDNNVLGLSYDYIGGERFLTVGIGASTPVVDDGVVDLLELRDEFSTFDSWAEVYRIKVGEEDTVHYLTTATCVKSFAFSEGRPVSSFFRSNKTIASMLNIYDYGTGDLRIFMNSLRDLPTDPASRRTVTGLQNAFYYYDETVDRITQLEYPADFVDGYKTKHFVGFNRDGTILTSLVNPNLLP